MVKKLFTEHWQLLIIEIKAHKFVYCSLFVVFLIGLFLRTYRQSDLLGFYFDQGRDAVEVQKILHGNFTLIGPTTGFAGIFRGPFFYYWLIPGYLLGNGNPAIAAVYISAINALGILVIYACGALFFSRIAGLIAATLIALSYYATTSARWLSNPSPVWFFGPLALLCTGLAFRKSWNFLPIGLLSLGLTMQLEEAGMGFVVLVFFVCLATQWKRLSFKQWAISFTAFAITFAPLALFDLRNDFLNTRGVLHMLGGSDGDKSFGLASDWIIKLRSYSGEFGKELFINDNLHTFTTWSGLVMIIIIVGLVLALLQYRKNRIFLFLLLWLVVPLTILLFYQKPLYEYYLVGLYPIFFLVIGVALAQYLRWRIGIAAIVVALGITVFINKTFLTGYLRSKVAADSSTITFENQKLAIDYIYKSSQGKTLAVAVYVPPQLTYEYDYLLPWYRRSYYPTIGETPLDQAQLFYTLHEEDHEHPKLLEERIVSWDAIAPVVDSYRMGGITVEKRAVNKMTND